MIIFISLSIADVFVYNTLFSLRSQAAQLKAKFADLLFRSAKTREGSVNFLNLHM
jgi:hypothetical protein